MKLPLVQRPNWLGLGTTGLVLVLWAVAAEVLDYDGLPGPASVAASVGDLVSDGLVAKILHTVMVSLLAALIGIVVGAVLGLCCALIRVVHTYVESSFDVLRAVPAVALMPIALLLWGPEGRTEVIIGAYTAMWPMLVNTIGAVHNIHPQLDEVARMFRFDSRRRVMKIVLPAATPTMLVGARLAATAALVAVIVAEMIATPAGIGWAMIDARDALQYSQLWALAIITGLLGLAYNATLTWLVSNVGPVETAAKGVKVV